MTGWGTAVGKIFNWLPGREESRRTQIAKLEKKRKQVLKEPDTAVNRRRVIAIDQRLQHLRDQALNQ